MSSPAKLNDPSYSFFFFYSVVTEMIHIRPRYTSDVVYHSDVEHADVVTRPPKGEARLTSVWASHRCKISICCVTHTVCKSQSYRGSLQI